MTMSHSCWTTTAAANSRSLPDPGSALVFSNEECGGLAVDGLDGGIEIPARSLLYCWNIDVVWGRCPADEEGRLLCCNEWSPGAKGWGAAA